MHPTNTATMTQEHQPQPTDTDAGDDITWVPAIPPTVFGFPGINPREEVLDGLHITFDHDLATRDGTILRADIYRPQHQSEDLPVLLCYSPYGKHHALKHYVFYPNEGGLDPGQHSKHYNFEGLDPLWWCPRGYIVAYVDTRGSFASQGNKYYYKEVDSYDVYDTIEALAKIRGSNGAVGMGGASALAIYQWMGAVLQPPSLKAFIPFDGMTDILYDFYSHGGIPESQFSALYETVFAFGNADGNKVEQVPRPGSHSLRADTGFWKSVTPSKFALPNITAPLYVICGYQNAGLHTRGTLRGFTEASSPNKYLELHGYRKWEWQLEEECLLRQKAFYDKFLKGLRDTEVEHWPKVRLQLREKYYNSWWRQFSDWPVPETQWTQLYLHKNGSLHAFPTPNQRTISLEGATAKALSWDWLAKEKTSLAGPAKLKLWIEAIQQDDADIFVHLEKLDRQNKIVDFPWADYKTHGVAKGWLRCSRRELDTARSTPYQPILTLGPEQKLEKHKIVPVEIEIIPFSLELRAGERLRISIGGSDFFKAEAGEMVYQHKSINHGMVAIHHGGKYDSHVLLPFLPSIVGPQTAAAVDKPMQLYLGLRRLPDFSDEQIVTEYVDVHTFLTKASVTPYPFGLAYQQLYAYPTTEIQSAQDHLPFAAPKIEGKAYDGVTRLTFTSVQAFQFVISTPQYEQETKTHQFAVPDGCFGVVTQIQEEMLLNNEFLSRKDFAVYLLHGMEASDTALAARTTTIQSIGCDSDLKVYRRAVNLLATQQDADGVFKGSFFERMDFTTYRFVEEFIFPGMDSAVGFFIRHAQALQNFNFAALAQAGYMNFAFDKINDVEKVLRKS